MNKYAMHILLDLDGTLTDPKEGITKSIVFALRTLDVAVPNEHRLVACIGPPLSESFEQLLPEPTTERVEKAIAHYRTQFTRQGIFENTLYPGIPEALAKLISQGAILHLATSKPQVYAQQILEHFELVKYFSSVNGSELDGRRANKAELIAYILEQQAIKPDRAIMIGDRSHDIVGAIANNIKTVGVLWGYGSRSELVQTKAEQLLEAPNNLPDIMSAAS
ncbi:MAG: HAD hydrolase-like protein [Cyanobacteria bacterium P01_F01_bin.53]